MFGKSDMKRFLRPLIIFLILTLLITDRLIAENYYIDASSGNDKNSGNFHSPWQTLSKANSALKPGDIVFLRAGEYSSNHIAPLNSGKAGYYITYQNYNGEKVIISGGKTQISLNYKDYIKIKGIIFRSPSLRWATIQNSNFLIIDSCIFEGITQYMSYNIFYVINCDYAQFIDSSWDGISQRDGKQHDMAVFDYMNHSLWLRCYFGSTTHDTFAARKADRGNGYNVVKDSAFENRWRHGLVTGDPYQHWLIEGNTFKNGGSDYNSSPRITSGEMKKTNRISSTIKHDGIDFIIRNNVLYGNCVDLTFRSLLGGKVNGLWFYHNSSYNQRKSPGNEIGGFAIYGEVESGVTNTHIINNIFWKFDGSRSGPNDFQVYVKGSGIKNNKIESNIFGREGEAGYYRWDVDNIEIKGNLETIEKNTNSWANNIEANPQFASPEKQQFNLKSGSPAIDAGTHIALTRGGAEMASTSLVCDHVEWAFSGPYPPWRIKHPDISTDKIYFQLPNGTWIEREIRNINYISKTIELNFPATWENGTPVYYKPFKGLAPDIGAFENGSDSSNLQPPKNLVVK